LRKKEKQKEENEKWGRRNKGRKLRKKVRRKEKWLTGSGKKTRREKG
jgi:hypothetical protein